MEITVARGQSLWSIAKDRLPPGATDAQVAAAVGQVARANGLSADARLQVGQKLVVPDAFAGVLTSNPTTADAMARLGSGNRVNATLFRAGQSAAPLIPLKAQFNPTQRVPVGEVALPDIAGVNVAARQEQFQGVKSFVHPSAFLTVDARLGKLTQSQFDDVKKAFGGCSTVKFDPQREYTAVDFLPPKLQALVNQDLETMEPVTLKGTAHIGADMSPDPQDRQVGLTMNCHATAWEAARAYQGHAQDVSVFYGEMITMDALTHDEQKFQVVAQLEASQVGELTKLDLRPGDIIQFHEVSDWARMTMLLHSAVYAGGGLFFEKPNTEGPEKADPARYVTQEETPFRLATAESMVQPVSNVVEGKFRVEVLRAKGPLEEPREAFRFSLAGDFATWAEKKGRKLGVELVAELEQGMGGNIRAEHASALVTVPLRTHADGTSSLRS
ncbi:MAG: LysM peptidoglycan-binding domain-containing protein [Myxococcota bacterium]